MIWPINLLTDRFSNSSGRSKEAMRNIILSFFAKGISVASSLLIVPLTIHYVNPTQYGIWLTLSSIIGWVAFFDLGFGNGFRNRFAEAKAQGDLELAKNYLSTTYFAVAGIVFVVFFVILIGNRFVDWASFLNIDSSYNEELSAIFVILAFFFCFSMVANLVCTMLTADQKAGLASLIQGGGQFLALIALWILTRLSEGSLTNLALYFAGIPCLFTVFVSIIVYSSGSYRVLLPQVSKIKISLLRDIMGLGIQFFIIYLCMILVFQIINVVISRELGPEAVTEYNIAYKYFSVINMVINIIVLPFWSAFTNAYQTGDILWMKKVVKVLERFWFVSSIATLMMLIFSNWVYKIWVGSDVVIDFSLSVAIAIYMIINNLGAIYLNLINGIGTVRIQMIVYFVFALLSWPLMVLLGREYGVVGIVFVPTMALVMLATLAKLQLHRIMDNTAEGIWAK